MVTKLEEPQESSAEGGGGARLKEVILEGSEGGVGQGWASLRMSEGGDIGELKGLILDGWVEGGGGAVLKEV